MKKSTYQLNSENNQRIIRGIKYIGLNNVKLTKQLILENNKEISNIMRKELYEKIVTRLDEILNNQNNNVILLSYFYQIKGKLLLLRYSDYIYDSKLQIYKDILGYMNYLICNFDTTNNSNKLKHILQLLLKLNNFQQF